MTDTADGPALDAAIRAAQRRLDALEEEAKQAFFEASRNGRLGSSSYPIHLSGILQKGFREAATDAAALFAKLKGRRALNHLDKFRGSLNDLRYRVITAFDKYDGTGTLFAKPAQVRSDLEGRLVAASDGLREDLAAGVFFLDAPAAAEDVERDQGTRANEQAVKMALLSCFARGRAHKINVLGRPGSPGALENELGFQLEPSERSSAGRYFAELVADGLIEPTYTDIADPENWLVITEPGKEALRTGALDELDAALLSINATLVDMRRGARAAALSNRADAGRQAAHSGRELLNQVLHALAPEDDVRAQPNFGSQTQVTRKARLRYAMSKRGSVSDSELDVLEAFAQLGDALYNKLSAEAHGRTPARDVSAFLRSVDLILERLFF